MGTIASPSRPSVRLTAFADPRITNITNGIENKPKFRNISLRKGKDNNWISISL